MLHAPHHMAGGYIGLGTKLHHKGPMRGQRCGRGGGVDHTRAPLSGDHSRGRPRWLVGRSMAGGGRHVIRKMEDLCKISVNALARWPPAGGARSRARPPCGRGALARAGPRPWCLALRWSPPATPARRAGRSCPVPRWPWCSPKGAILEGVRRRLPGASHRGRGKRDRVRPPSRLGVPWRARLWYPPGQDPWVVWQRSADVPSGPCECL
jgi:hypothetical protein